MEHAKAEEEKRKGTVETVSAQLNGISERLTGQQKEMEAQAAENERLRKQLAAVGDVAQMNVELKAQHEAELATMRDTLAQQVRPSRCCCTAGTELASQVRPSRCCCTAGTELASPGFSGAALAAL